jgi:hypothetical protein
MYGGNKLSNRIYELVRQIRKEESIPAEREETVTVPFHKTGDRDKCENYRGITLGNAAYKILLNTTKPYIEKIMGDYQNGFRDGRSVTDNILH